VGRRRVPALALALALFTLVLAACGGDDDDSSGDGGSSGSTSAGGVETFPVTSRSHVTGRVNYPQTPPVGGDHNAAWQNCGFYSQPIEPEFAVHSLEHGAVWITHRPDLPRQQIDELRDLAREEAYVLVSPWRDGSLPAPVVASAWGVQLKLESATDPELDAFVDDYAGRGNAPEPGASCSGAIGTPE
jgi:hypothetical protein